MMLTVDDSDANCRQKWTSGRNRYAVAYFWAVWTDKFGGRPARTAGRHFSKNKLNISLVAGATTAGQSATINCVLMLFNGRRGRITGAHADLHLIFHSNFYLARKLVYFDCVCTQWMATGQHILRLLTYFVLLKFKSLLKTKLSYG